jgi:hypothetical protein
MSVAKTLETTKQRALFRHREKPVQTHSCGEIEAIEAIEAIATTSYRGRWPATVVSTGIEACGVE